jgi:hypothetical protein
MNSNAGHIFLAAIITLSSCTQNERVKRFGGSAAIDIPADRQFVNVTWKENDLWVVTKTRTTSDTLHNVYQLQESSSWGILEGTYTINETR